MDTAMEIVPASRADGRVKGVYAACGQTFATEKADALNLAFEGIAGDVHAGATRRSGAREPWYPRGTEMRNNRQVSLLCPDELADVAADMAIETIRPEWIGGNLLIEAIPFLSMLPAGTLLFFENGVTLKVDGQNRPCRHAGQAVAERYPDRDRAGLALGFVEAARRRRGLVAWVERPGRIEPGEAVRAQIEEQWIYAAA